MSTLYGITGEFESPERLLLAARGAYSAGYRRMDAFTPFPVEGLAEIVSQQKDRVAPIALLGGISGAAVAFGMQWYSNVIDYPMNIGGRPYFSWPAFIPVTFELTVLGAALSAAFGMLWLNRLPQLWHPMFHLTEFSRASRDRFFLCIQSKDSQFDVARVSELLLQFNPLSVNEVPLED